MERTGRRAPTAGAWRRGSGEDGAWRLSGHGPDDQPGRAPGCRGSRGWGRRGSSRRVAPRGEPDGPAPRLRRPVGRYPPRTSARRSPGRPLLAATSMAEGSEGSFHGLRLPWGPPVDAASMGARRTWLSRQPAAAALIATAQLGVPAAVVTLGLRRRSSAQPEAQRSSPPRSRASPSPRSAPGSSPARPVGPATSGRARKRPPQPSLRRTQQRTADGIVAVERS
jgi:hypothetical protein